MSLTAPVPYSQVKEGKDGSDAYILNTGKEAARILDIQHGLYAQDSYEHVAKAGLQAGQTVWDVGCGGGAMTEYFSKKVGDAGHVYALDASQRQLDVAKERFQKLGVTNITFIEGDISTVDNLPAGNADMVYARFVFMHLANPEKGLENAYNLLKPGGMLALQESIMSTSHVSAKMPLFEDYMKAIVAAGKYKGADFDIGIRLQTLCENAGFQNRGSYFLQKKMPVVQAKSLMLSRFYEFGGAAIEAGVANEETLEQWRNTIETLPESDPEFYVSFARQAYILAQKQVH